jgi:two-component system response regulator NreC
MSIRILLADDHNLMRQGVRTLINEQPGMAVIAEAADGASAVRLALDVQPDIVIMDVSMPGMGGIEATRRLFEEKSRSKVIALSMHPERCKVLDMLSAGASGYLLKDCLFEEVVCAVRTVLSNEMYLSPAVVERILIEFVKLACREEPSPLAGFPERDLNVLRLSMEGKDINEIAGALSMSVPAVSASLRGIILDCVVPYFSAAGDSATPAASPFSLTLREREILAWIRDGKGSWEISSILGLSQETVKYHLKKTYRKLNATNRTQALAVALHNNLLDA